MPQAIVGFIAALGVPGLVGAGGALTTLGTVLAGGISLGLSLGLQALFGQRPKGPTPKDVKSVVSDSIAPRKKVYGRDRVGGSRALIETREGDLYQVVMLSQGPIDAVEGTIVDNNEVTLSGGGAVTEAPYDGNSVEVHYRLGARNQNALAGLVSALPGVWTSNHRLRGIAYAMVVARSVEQDRFNEVYPQRFPALNAVIRGCMVFDPRDDATKWSANLALILRAYLVDEDGGRIDAAMIDETLFAAAADVCDETVPTEGGGTINRYHGSLTYSFDEEPKAVIERVLTAMDGRLFLTPEGKIGLLAGKWIAPTVTLTDREILDYDLDDSLGPHRAANEVVVKFTHVEADFAEATAAPWRNEAAISAYGDTRTHEETIFGIQHHNHARRIAKLLDRRLNPEWSGTIRTTLAGMRAIDQRWIRLQIADLDIDGTYEVTAWSLDRADMTVTLQVAAFEADAYTFNPAVEEGTAPAIPADTSSEDIPAPSAVSISLGSRKVDTVWIDDSDTVYDNVTETNDTVTTPRTYTATAPTLRVAVSAPPKAIMMVQAQYRNVTDADWEPLSVNQSTHRSRPELVERGETYIARARYRGAGEASEWSESVTVTVPA